MVRCGQRRGEARIPTTEAAFRNAAIGGTELPPHSIFASRDHVARAARGDRSPNTPKGIPSKQTSSHQRARSMSPVKHTLDLHTAEDFTQPPPGKEPQLALHSRRSGRGDLARLANIFWHCQGSFWSR